MSGASEALQSYQQADEEGVMVLVSRQAIHEVLDERADLLDALEALLGDYKLACDEWVEDAYEHGQELVTLTEKAIAKAKGEQP